MSSAQENALKSGGWGGGGVEKKRKTFNKLDERDCQPLTDK